MKRTDLYLAALLVVVSGCIFAPLASIWVDPHHDGIMLKPALDVLSGQTLFRDTFSQYGPLTTYLQVLALKVSPTLLSMRYLTVLAYAGALGLFYLTWRAILPRPLAILSAGLYVLLAAFYHPNWPMLPWSSTLALFFQAMAMLAFSRIIAGEKGAVWSWVFGAAVACTFWCRQPVGVFLAGSAVVVAGALHYCGWRSPSDKPSRIWGRAGLALVLVSAMFIVHFALNGSLGAWWEQNILWPRRWATGDIREAFWRFARFYLSQKSALILLAILAVVFLPAFLRRRFAKLPVWFEAVWLLLACGGYLLFREVLRPSLLIEIGGWRMVILAAILVQAVWLVVVAFTRESSSRSEDFFQVASMSGLVLASIPQIYPIACANHVYWALAPGLGLFIYVVQKCVRVPAVWIVVTFVVVLCPAVYEKWMWARYNFRVCTHVLTEPKVLAGIRVDAELGNAITNVQRIIDPLLRANPNQKVLMYGSDAMYLTWFNSRENPTPEYVVWDGILDESAMRARWTYLVRERPVVLLNGPGANALKAIPSEYRLVIHEPRLALRIMVPAGVGTDLPTFELPDSATEVNR